MSRLESQLLADDMDNARAWSKDCDPHGCGWRPTIRRMADEIDRLNRRATPAWELDERARNDLLRASKMLLVAADALDTLQSILAKGALTEEDHDAIRALDESMCDAAIRKATDLDRAWAWFRESAAGLGRNSALEIWECWVVGECYGSGPTKSAAVLDAWRGAKARGGRDE